MFEKGLPYATAKQAEQKASAGIDSDGRRNCPVSLVRVQVKKQVRISHKAGAFQVLKTVKIEINSELNMGAKSISLKYQLLNLQLSYNIPQFPSIHQLPEPSICAH